MRIEDLWVIFIPCFVSWLWCSTVRYGTYGTSLVWRTCIYLYTSTLLNFGTFESSRLIACAFDRKEIRYQLFNFFSICCVSVPYLPSHTYIIVRTFSLRTHSLPLWTTNCRLDTDELIVVYSRIVLAAANRTLGLGRQQARLALFIFLFYLNGTYLQFVWVQSQF